MGNRACEGCGEPMGLFRSHARTCSPRCRKRAERIREFRSVPVGLTERARWVRWETRRMIPLTLTGYAASSTDPATWATFPAAKGSDAGNGLGFVLNGDGLACIVLEHCLIDGKPAAGAQGVLDRFPSAWVEVSGDGLHVWGTAPGQPGRRRSLDGLDAGFYTRGRCIPVTGLTYRAGGLDERLELKALEAPNRKVQA